MALVEIRRFYGPEEAQVAASMLRANGVEVLIQNEQLGMTDFLVRNAVGGFRLWVSEDDKELAESLLPPIEAPRPAAAAPAPVRPALNWGLGLKGLLFGR
jgi:hypothetical protein